MLNYQSISATGPVRRSCPSPEGLDKRRRKVTNLRIFKQLLFPLMLFLGLFNTPIFAMEYGDRVQTTGVYITSWLSNKYQAFYVQQTGSQVVTPELGMLVTSIPAMSVSKQCALAIAGTALTFWVFKKIYNWVKPTTERGEQL